MMPLTPIRGKGGSGKNTYFAYHIYKNKFLLHRVRKFTNFDFDAPKTEKYNSIKLLELDVDDDELIICGVDEAYVEMDCRNSLDLQNKLNGYLGFQARKNNSSIVPLTQLDILDLRWRKLEEKSIIAFDRPILNKDLTPYKGDFHYVLLQNGRKPVYFTLYYSTAEKLFRFFKTKQKILPEDIDELKMRLNLRNAKTRKEVVNKVVLEILDNNKGLEKKDITHDWLKNEFLDLEIPNAVMSLEPYVYIRLKAKI